MKEKKIEQGGVLGCSGEVGELKNFLIRISNKDKRNRG